MRYAAALRELGYYIDNSYRRERIVYRGDRGSKGIVTDAYKAAEAAVVAAHTAKHPKVTALTKKVDALAAKTIKAFEKIRVEAEAEGIAITVPYIGNFKAKAADQELEDAKNVAKREIETKVEDAVQRLADLYELACEKILLATLTQVENVDEFFGFPDTKELLA